MTEREIRPESENKLGKVVAVCLSHKRVYPKYPQERVIVGRYWIVGDAHAGQNWRTRTKPDL